jgi:hypothetical protein
VRRRWPSWPTSAPSAGSSPPTPPHGAAQAQTVTSTANAGPGTLRAAINQANANANLSVIDFNLPGAGVNTITPANNLPVLVFPVEIDGAGVVIDTVNTAWGLALNTGGSMATGGLGNSASGAVVTGNGNQIDGNVSAENNDHRYRGHDAKELIGAQHLRLS